MTEPAAADISSLRADLDQLRASLRERDRATLAEWEAVRASLVAFGSGQRQQRQQQASRHDAIAMCSLAVLGVALAAMMAFTPRAFRTIQSPAAGQ